MPAVKSRCPDHQGSARIKRRQPDRSHGEIVAFRGAGGVCMTTTRRGPERDQNAARARPERGPSEARTIPQDAKDPNKA
jgi:hypothetical protein